MPVRDKSVRNGQEPGLVVCGVFIGSLQSLLGRITGTGKGAGMGLIFVMVGMIGIILIILLGNNHNIRDLERKEGA